MSESPKPIIQAVQAAQQPKPQKISKEMSNFVVTLVLERSDDLIRNSYRRLTTENVARNEHWQNIAEIVANHFGQPVETERIKSHFHNRKKVLLARIKDEMRHIPNTFSIDEKIEELVKRRILGGEYDEQLAKVCLDIEEEERNRTDLEAATASSIGQVFGDHAHQSLLSQLLNSTTSSVDFKGDFKPDFKLLSEASPLPSSSSRESGETTQCHAPLLSKLLTQTSTSSATENELMNSSTPYSSKRKSIPVREMQNFTPFSQLQQQNRYLSHLIVDVTSTAELKRLLSVLIDHGFSRFQHVESLDNLGSGGTSGQKQHENVEPNYSYFDCMAEKEDELSQWNGISRENENDTQDLATGSENGAAGDIELLCSSDRVEQIEVEVKTENRDGDDSENTDELDEEALLADVQQKSMALFERKMVDMSAPPAKKPRGCATEAPIVPCELCKSVIRLNTGGSKWNLFEHVVLKHSEHRPFKCSLCPYESARKIRIRQHGASVHNVEVEAVDAVTPEIRKEWDDKMAVCFPMHRYGKHSI